MSQRNSSNSFSVAQQNKSMATTRRLHCGTHKALN